MREAISEATSEAIRGNQMRCASTLHLAVTAAVTADFAAAGFVTRRGDAEEPSHHLMREAIRCNQMQSEEPSHHLMREAIRCNQRNHLIT
jgi:hypothetical protein